MIIIIIILALPVSSCGMKLVDDAVRVAVSLRLGCSICVAHTCRSATVDVQGQYGVICKQAPSRIVWHNVMNDIIFRSLSSAEIPASKNPIGQTRLDGKRLDGLTPVASLWRGGPPRVTPSRGDTRKKKCLWANLQRIVEKRGRTGKKKVWGDTLEGVTPE